MTALPSIAQPRGASLGLARETRSAHRVVGFVVVLLAVLVVWELAKWLGGDPWRIHGTVLGLRIDYEHLPPTHWRIADDLSLPHFWDVARAFVDPAQRNGPPLGLVLAGQALFTFREAGNVAEGEGCAYIALHGRTAKQMYSGKARWEYIGELKERVKIPVLGNGDIFEAPDAFRMMEETGCDGVVIGRGCLGNPWLFRNLKGMFDGASEPTRPPIEELVAVVREHFSLLVSHFSKEPRSPALMMRKFGTWYARGLEGATALRREFQTMNCPADLDRILESMLRLGYETGFRGPGEATRETRMDLGQPARKGCRGSIEGEGRESVSRGARF